MLFLLTGDLVKLGAAAICSTIILVADLINDTLLELAIIHRMDEEASIFQIGLSGTLATRSVTAPTGRAFLLSAQSVPL